MSVKKCVFVFLVAVSVGCGSSDAALDSGLDAGPEAVVCADFCDKGHTECEALPETTDRSQCVRGCELDLANTGLVSEDCRDLLDQGFACAAALGCSDFAAWLARTPPDSYPCREQVLATIVTCE